MVTFHIENIDGKPNNQSKKRASTAGVPQRDCECECECVCVRLAQARMSYPNEDLGSVAININFKNEGKQKLSIIHSPFGYDV